MGGPRIDSLISHHEDFSNLLLIFAKFLLVAYITASTILAQLGLDPWAGTQLLNATPASQNSSDGGFDLSFYAVSDRDDDRVRIDVYACRPAVDECQAPFEAHPGETAAGWRALGSETYEIADSSERAGLLDQLASLFRLHRARKAGRVSFNLDENGSAAPAGSYVVAYNYVFASEAGAWAGESRPRWMGETFEINLSSADDGLWRLPLAIVRGQSSAIPVNLESFRIATRPNSKLRLERSGRRLGIEYNRLSSEERNEGFEERLLIETTVQSTNPAASSFSTVDGRTVTVGPDTKMVRYDEQENTYFRRDLGAVQPGDRVYFFPAEGGEIRAEVVRSGTRVPLILSVALRENLRPRGIYREDSSGLEVRLRIPRDLYLGVVNGERMWYFNLNRHVLDPDGVDGAGDPRVEIQQNRVSWTDGGQPANYRLVWQQAEDGLPGRQLIRILDPQEAGQDDLTIRVRDDWSYSDVRLLIRPMNRQTWDVLGRQIRQ